MRKLLALIIASTFLTAVPVIPQPVEAQTLFETLFPRTAKRREARKQRSQVLHQRQLKRQAATQRKASQQETRSRKKASTKVKLAGHSYTTYFARSIKSVRLTDMAKAFGAYEQKLLVTNVLPREKTNSPELSEQLDTRSTGSIDAQQPKLTVETKVIEERQENVLAPVRLSAGAAQLKTISLNSSPALGKAVVAYYKSNPEFIWLDGEGRPNSKATAVLRVLADAEAYGLPGKEYAIQQMTVGDEASKGDILRAAMQYEFSTTIAVLRYISDARNGRVDPNRISGYHDFNELNSNFGKIIGDIAKNESPDEIMLGAHPRDQSFTALKTELAKLRGKSVKLASVEIKQGTLIKPGQTNDQLENVIEGIRRKASAKFLTQNFDAFALDYSDGEYVEEAVELVREFQQSVNLKPDGIIGKNTISRVLGDNPKAQMNKVLYAMERLRWHPDSLGNTRVFINQPAYRATFMKNGKQELSMRVVVGKPSNQTNFFYDKIEYVDFNPYWGIPRSILVNEMLPKLRRNASYMDNLGYEITTMKGKRISSSNIDWYSVGANFPYNVRQPPGSTNALGRLKIMFPNKHAIYMHDTPAKNLFERDTRAYSYGCVRLAQPLKMAAAVLGTNLSSVKDRISGGKNNRQNLKQKVPIYIAYFTAWPNSSGKIDYYSDVYGRDKALAKAMLVEEKARAKALGS